MPDFSLSTRVAEYVIPTGLPFTIGAGPIPGVGSCSIGGDCGGHLHILLHCSGAPNRESFPSSIHRTILQSGALPAAIVSAADLQTGSIPGATGLDGGIAAAKVVGERSRRRAARVVVD